MHVRKWAPRSWAMPLAALMIVATPILLLAAPAGNSFVQHNLVSDIPGLASYTDHDLINPWGWRFRPVVRFGSTITASD
jgi:hypothetical protein